MGDTYEKRARQKRKERKKREKNELKRQRRALEPDEKPSDEEVAARYLDLPEHEDQDENRG